MKLTQSDVDKIKEEIEHRKIGSSKGSAWGCKGSEGPGRFEREFWILGSKTRQK